MTISFGDRSISARQGDSVAVALLAAGIVAARATALSGSPRGPFCLMGACFECLAVVDGRANVRTCMIAVRNGMRVEWQDGPPTLGADAAHSTTPKQSDSPSGNGKG